MNTHQYSKTAATIVIGTALLLFSDNLLPQNSIAQLPGNSHASLYSDSWKCNHGYNKKNKKCIVITLPENSYLEPSGKEWRCLRGYKKEDNTCNPMSFIDAS